MLKVLFTQDSEVEDLFCGASKCSELSLFFSNNLFSLEFEPVQDDSQHDFTWMTDEALVFIILAEQHVTLLRECNNQRLVYGLAILLFSRSCYRSLSKYQSWLPFLF